MQGPTPIHHYTVDVAAALYPDQVTDNDLVLEFGHNHDPLIRSQKYLTLSNHLTIIVNTHGFRRHVMFLLIEFLRFV